MDNININDFKHKKVHFIGIGGISMSALAEILLSRGYAVSGSDLTDSNLLTRLQDKGAKIYLGHDASHAQGADIVIYTAAIKPDNPEMQEALRKNLPIMQRSVLLGQIMRTYPIAIGVSGSHGKTTTTSMLSMAMVDAKLDPTVLLGGELNALGGNVRIGQSPYFITEACEYVESFLHFYPYIAVILNIDRDHLDYFKDIEHIYDTFLKYAKLVPKDGYVVGCIDDPLVEKLMSEVDCNTISYGITKKGDFTAESVILDDRGCASFNVSCDGQVIRDFALHAPGRHNVYNALATLAAAHCMNIPINDTKDFLRQYTGTQRRFEYKGSFNGITVIDDYAHHPAEIKATLSTVQNIPHRKIRCVFQPHTYTRTIKLFDEFVTAFDGIDELIITDIYSAREKDTKEVHPSQLSHAISKTGVKSLYISSFEDISEYLVKNACPDDIIMTIGAGDVYKIGEMLLRED